MGLPTRAMIVSSPLDHRQHQRRELQTKGQTQSRNIRADQKCQALDVTKKQAVAEQYDSSPQLWLPRRR